MKISNFNGAQDKVPKQLEITWEYFAAHLGPHEYRHGDKTQVPAFSPAEYRDVPEGAHWGEIPSWAKRHKDNVVRVWMLVLDVDEVLEQVYRGLVAYVQQLGLAAVVYSTWSHAASVASTGLWKFRVVIPLDRPVYGSEWREFWHRASALFGDVCDPACKDASRLYFGPFAPVGTEHVNFYYALEGSPLSVDVVNSVPLPASAATGQSVDAANLKQNLAEAASALAAAWPSQRRHEAHLALAGGLLSSGMSDDAAVEFLCSVASQHEGSQEERDKRVSAVEHTRQEISAGNNVTGWTTLASIVGYDVVERVRALVEKPPDIDVEQLRGFAKHLKKSRDDKKVEMGQALQKVCECKPFPEALWTRLAGELGTRFVDYDAHSIAEWFRPSLALMTAGEMVMVEQIEARIRMRQDEERAKRQEQREKRERQERVIDEDKANRIRESFNNGRSHPYTAEELVMFQPIIASGHQWILQKDRAFYFFHYGKFRGPYTESEAHNAALRELAPASTAGVEVYKITKEGGAEFKSLKQLVAEYGSVADELVLDVRAQATTYDYTTRRITEAPCPLRSIAPTYHSDIDEWLFHFAGPEYWYDLKTWLAILPRLDIVRVALFLTGPKGVGKSLLPLGCSRLWTTRGPTPLDNVFAAFNDMVAGCPLCFADEQLPKDYRGYTMNPQLRHHIQATERSFKRKFLPNAKLIGVLPTIVSAHDPSILRTPEELSNNEIEGTMERYFHIPVRPEAGDFLRRMRPTTFERGWVEGDKIAEFVMWLYYNHQHSSAGRFYINRPDVENTRWLATSSGARSAVLRWLCSFLADRRAFESNAGTLMHVRVLNGKLLVNIKGILKFWDTYVGNENCPTSGKLAQTISELSHEGRVQLKDSKGVPTNYRVIVTDNLLAWAKNSDLITEEEIHRQLGVDSVQASLGLVAR